MYNCLQKYNWIPTLNYAYTYFKNPFEVFTNMTKYQQKRRQTMRADHL